MRFLRLGALAMTAAATTVGSAYRLSPDSRPATILWAWERPEDLRFLDPRSHGIAFLASTIRLTEGAAVVRRRMQPLLVPEHAALIAVVRIEAEHRVDLNESQRQNVAAELLRCAALPRVAELQIDFDARASERAFYRSILIEARHRLPAGTRVSITALASWCAGDPWLEDLPVAEAVPMLFRMGPGGGAIRAALTSGRDFGPAVCRTSAGVSLDEPPTAVAAGRRLFVFNPRPWSPASVRETLRFRKAEPQ